MLLLLLLVLFLDCEDATTFHRMFTSAVWSLPSRRLFVAVAWAAAAGVMGVQPLACMACSNEVVTRCLVVDGTCGCCSLFCKEVLVKQQGSMDEASSASVATSADNGFLPPRDSRHERVPRGTNRSWSEKVVVGVDVLAIVVVVVADVLK